MGENKNEILSVITKMEKKSASEIQMLNIRPYVATNDYCFHVFECDLEEVTKSLQAAEKLSSNCLVVTSPRAYYAARGKLPKSHNYVYVGDTKVDKLDTFVAECETTQYCSDRKKEVSPETLDDIKLVDMFVDECYQPMGAETDRNFQLEKVGNTEKELYSKCVNGYYLKEIISSDNVDTVIALGGGVAMDASQYLATKLSEKLGKKINLLCIPTALSVNAAFCYKAALREKDKESNYHVKYFSGLTQPDAILIDPEIILTAGELNAVGAGDLLSCLTASFDWKLNSMVARYNTIMDENEKKKYDKISKPFNQEVCTGAMEMIGLLAEHIDDLNAMRKHGEILKLKSIPADLTKEKMLEIKEAAKNGLRFLCMAYHWVAEQSWTMQHTMWESASEHGMFDYMEFLCKTEFQHGKIIGLCVYFMSLLQENEHERAVSMIKRLGLDITLNNLTSNPTENKKVTLEKLIECLMGVQKFLTEDGYRYTFISAKSITPSWIEMAVESYYKDFPLDAKGDENKEKPKEGEIVEICKKIAASRKV